MTELEAKKFVADLKIRFQVNNVWCTVTEVHEPGLKFMKVEASIKVDQQPTLNSSGGI